MKAVTFLLSLVIGLVACGGTTSPTQARTFYVDANVGDDAASGDGAHPFRTVQHAADLVNPGDVVVMRNGVYTGGGSVLDIQRGGTAGNYVVFRAA
ncbi:MAG: hypothetical protein DMD61_08555, partial [Gemmatimonadetes bacterium]